MSDSHHKMRTTLRKCFRSKILIYTLLIMLMCTIICQRLYLADLHKTRMFSLRTLHTLYTYPINALPFNDYHQLIDLKDFRFTMMNFPCNNILSPPLLIVLVHSKPTHFLQRNTIRRTWGSFSSPAAQMRLLFMLGQVGNNTELQQQLSYENEKFRDLIQGSFFDSYTNLTYKHVMLFKYLIYHCPQAKYILKTDDDAFVNTPLLMNFITADLSPHGASRMLFCFTSKHNRVNRVKSSKWYVPVSENPASSYPPFCPGWFILYSQDVVFELYREAQRAPYFRLDDVHLTGILAKKINLSHVNNENVVLSFEDFITRQYSLKCFNKLFLFGKQVTTEMEDLWESVKRRETPQSLLENVDLLEIKSD